MLTGIDIEEDIINATCVDFAQAAFKQFDGELVSLLEAMMSIDPARRPTAAEVLQHLYIRRRGSRARNL